MSLKRGDISGPVLAILVTLILLAIGAVIIAYFTLFTGGTAQPVLSVTGQPIAYQSGTDAMVEITVVNTGSAPATLDNTETKLEILAPSDLAAKSASLGTGTTVYPGSTVALKFTFVGEWENFKMYRMATGKLTLVDTAGNTIGVYEVNIRIIGGG